MKKSGSFERPLTRASRSLAASRALTRFKVPFPYSCSQLGMAVCLCLFCIEMKMIPGALAWKLSDTFGFPLDLTKLMAEEVGLQVDEPGYLAAQAEAKVISKQGAKGGDFEADALQTAVDAFKLSVHQAKMLEALAPTDDSLKHRLLPMKGVLVKAIFQVDGETLLDQVQPSREQVLALVLDKTCFYAEAGGQMSDIGMLYDDLTENLSTALEKLDMAAESGSSSSSTTMLFKVLGVKAFSGHVIHLGLLLKGSLTNGAVVGGEIDAEYRHPLMLNHTATHMLNFAIQDTLQPAVVDQKGSLVAPDRLRFDYSCSSAPSATELASFEAIVNQQIQQDLPIYHAVVPLAQAKAIVGLRAVFGEVYPDPVRVVAVGHRIEEILQDPSNEKWRSTSIELCGGTHLAQTGPILDFVLLQETAIAKGIRRVIALTGDDAIAARKSSALFAKRVQQVPKDFSSLSSARFEEADALLKCLVKDLELMDVPLLDKLAYRTQLTSMRDAWDKHDKAKKNADQKLVTAKITKSLAEDKDAGIICEEFKVGSNTKALNAGLQLCIKASRPSFIYSREANVVFFYVCVPENVVSEKGPAVAWINKAFVDFVDGPIKAGGRPTFAQGSAVLRSSSIDAADLLNAIQKAY